eukprot:89356_1
MIVSLICLYLSLSIIRIESQAICRESEINTYHCNCYAKANCAYNTIINCTEFVNCNIICNEYACYYGTIHCPQYADCNVICNGQYSCLGTNIIWPSNGTQTIQCDGDGDQDCVGINFPIPPSNDDLILRCDSSLECYGSHIYCPESANCTIICNAYWSCKTANIYCPTAGDCNIICNATESCSNANVIWAINGTGTGAIQCDEGEGACYGINFPSITITAPSANNNFIMNCSKRYECAQNLIICPKFADCHIICGAEGACFETEIIWPLNGNGNEMNGIGSIQCDGYAACKGVHFPITNPFTDLQVICNSDYICYGAIIPCPEFANCHIVCDGDHACHYAEFNGTGTIECHGQEACRGTDFPQPPPNENFVLNCNDPKSCLQSNIYCPEFADCHIICGAGKSCYQANIYWSSEFVQSTLTCNDTMTVSRPFTACSGLNGLPPTHYSYNFDNIYPISTSSNISISHLIQIRNEFKLEFEMKIELETMYTDSYYNIISMVNEEEFGLFSLSLNTKQKQFELKANNFNDIYFIKNADIILPSDHGYHSISIQFRENDEKIFIIDDIEYFHAIISSQTLPTNNIYSVNIGNNIPDLSNINSINASITNISITINLVNYYEFFQETSETYCFQKSYDLSFSLSIPIAAYWDDIIYFIEGADQLISPSNTLYHSLSTNINFKNSSMPNLIGWTYTNSQSYTIINNSLYLHNKFFSISSTTGNINYWNWKSIIEKISLSITDNITTTQITSPFMTSNLEITDDIDGGNHCLSNNKTHMFMQSCNGIEIYDIFKDEWSSSNFTNLKWPKIARSSCQVYNHKMYIFGGDLFDDDMVESELTKPRCATYSWRTSEFNVFLDTIYEYDVVFDSLIVVNTSLNVAATKIKSYLFKQNIYLYGGLTKFANETFYFQIFNAATKQLFVSIDDRFNMWYAGGYYDELHATLMISDGSSVYSFSNSLSIFDFMKMNDKLVIPGDSFKITSDFFDITGCSPYSIDLALNSNISFQFISDLEIFGVNHEIKFLNGSCNQICDIHTLCVDCSLGIVPIILKSAINSSIMINIIASNREKAISLSPSFNIKISQCPIGEGYIQDSVFLNCQICDVNEFKINVGNFQCYLCIDQVNENNIDWISCDGSYLISIDYNVWFTGYRYNDKSNKLISQFDLNINYIIY